MNRHDVEAALERVPDYDRFFTLDEMHAKARDAVRAHPDLAELRVVGHSREGEEIPMVRIGDGPTRVLAFAFPHPNEPIGGMLVHFLLDELFRDPSLREGRTWYLLPSVDPDGTRANEGWFAGPFTIRNYARHFYRPPSAEQVEWTFPIDYEQLRFDRPLPETEALMGAFDQARPHLVYSLHNAGFGGVYYYLSHDVPEVYGTFHEVPERRDLPLSLGEPEMPWAETLAPAVYRMPSIRDAYDYHATYGEGSPAEKIQGGGSSFDFLRSMELADGDPVCLITELPYFQSPQVADESETERTRRDVILEGLDEAESTTRQVQEFLRRAEPHMTLDTRFVRAVREFTDQALAGLPSQKRWAREAEGMDDRATVAQVTDALHVGSFYRLLIASMLRRAIDAQRAATPDPRLDDIATDVEAFLDAWAQRLDDALDYEAIPIRKSVQVQYGALLALLAAPGWGPGA